MPNFGRPIYISVNTPLLHLKFLKYVYFDACRLQKKFGDFWICQTGPTNFELGQSHKIKINSLRT